MGQPEQARWRRKQWSVFGKQSDYEVLEWRAFSFLGFSSLECRCLKSGLWGACQASRTRALRRLIQPPYKPKPSHVKGETRNERRKEFVRSPEFFLLLAHR